MKTAAPLVALVVLALGVAACGEENSPSGGDPFGSEIWQLSAGTVDGAPLTAIEGAPVTLRVESGQLGGTAACNSYGTPLAVAAGTLTIGPDITVTEMACLSGGVMELEAAYLATLPRVTSAERDAGELVLRGDGVELRFVPQPTPEPEALVGTTWVLESLVAGDTAATPASEATLSFGSNGTVTGSTGCNRLSGTYDEATGFSALSTTKMACKDEIMAQESLVLELLRSGPTLTIEGGVLTIADLEGRALQYRAG